MMIVQNDKTIRDLECKKRDLEESEMMVRNMKV